MLKIIFLLASIGVLVKGSPPFLNRFGSKIIGGVSTNIEDHKYQVSLRTTDNYHFCGGSIISRNWVISAAHCTIHERPESLFVWAGTSYLASGGVRIGVRNIINHPDFHNVMLYNDISLLETDNIPINNVNIAITWPASHFTAPDREVVVTGWGLLHPQGQYPNQLQKLVKRTISNEECKTRVPAAWVSDEKVCAFAGTGKGSCPGDSGGPLTENGWLVGIVSWGIPCGLGYPDGYERIASHRAWITQITAV